MSGTASAAHLKSMLTPRIAHLIDARALMVLLPYCDQGDLHEIRCSFFRFLDSRAGRQHETWQAAWNAWTGATQHRPGQIEYTPSRCKACHGRGFSTRNLSRNLARTGSPHACAECFPRPGRGKPTRQVARYAPVPADVDAGNALDTAGS